VLQWVAVGCSGLQWVAVGCNGLQWFAVGCTGLQWVALGLGVRALNRDINTVASYTNCVAAIHCNIYRHAAMHCNLNRHAATRCQLYGHTLKRDINTVARGRRSE